MLLIHDIKYSDLLYNWKELQPGESGTITVSYEAEQPGDFYRTEFLHTEPCKSKQKLPDFSSFNN